MQPQADCGVHVHARSRRASIGHGPRRLPGDPRGRPGRDRAHRRARARRRRLRTNNANMRPLEFLRGLGCVDGDLHVSPHGRLPRVPARDRRRISYHPHSTRHAPSQPYANRDNADLGSLKKVERLIDRLQRLGRLRGTSTPLSLWLDEYGYQTNPPDRLRGVSPGAQDRYLQQAAYIAWRDPRVMLLAQYLWQDEPVAGRTQVHRLAIGPAPRRRHPEKPALAHFDSPDLVRLPRQRRVGPGPPRGRPPCLVQRRSRRRDELGVDRHGPDGGDGAWQVPRRRSRSRRTARSPTTAPRARR